MYALLKAPADRVIDNPTINLDQLRIDEPALTHSLRRRLLNRHKQLFDWQEGGNKSPVKYLDRDSVEYSISQALENNATEMRMAKLTLYRALALQDRIWGGIYQYATQNWHRPHYVMTMNNQAGYLRIYSIAHATWGNRVFRDAAILIRSYLSRFLLSPQQAFYAGQTDQIDQCDIRFYYASNENQRWHHGLPEIDTRVLTRENGWAIEALACCHEFCSDAASLQLAINAANWIVEHRTVADGGFRMEDKLSYRLADTLAMGRAFLQLYRATGDADWLIRASNAADFIGLHFYQTGGGYIPQIHTRVNNQKGPGIDENLALMRFTNLLSYYTGMKRHRKMAKHCFRYLCLDEVATAREQESGILLADQEYNEQPVNITIIGDQDNKSTQLLRRSALQHPDWYKQLMFYTPAEAPVNSLPMYYGDEPVAIVKHPYCETGHFHHPEQLAEFLRKI